MRTSRTSHRSSPAFPSAVLLSLGLLFASGCGGEGSEPSDSSDTTATGGTGNSTYVGAGGNSAAGGSSAVGGSDSATGGTDGSGGHIFETETAAASYDHGYSPTTMYVEHAQAAYDDWKAVHLEDCGSGKYRVRWENDRLDATVSEGIGYGMLLAVVWGEQDVVDGLYAYYQSALSSNGLMHWLRYGCDAHRETKYNAYPDNAAADADLDVAMALIMADCKWGDGSYDTKATTIIQNIRTHMFTDDGDVHVLQAGDADWFDGADMRLGCVNYSYFAPAYYRAFADYDTTAATFWNNAAADTYTLLERASHASTGLVRNWGSSDGGGATSECHNAYNRAGSYGDDAARTPWRIATDYLWYGTADAKAWTDVVTAWVASEGIEDVVQWYNLDGTPDTTAGTWDDHTAITIGPWATGAMTYDQATVDAFTAELISIPTSTGSHDAEYFPRMLKVLSLATLAGKFTACGGD